MALGQHAGMAKTPSGTASDSQHEIAALRATVADLEAKLESAREQLGEVQLNRDGVTAERSAMWRDYCRLRDVLHLAFPAIPDPEAKRQVGEALDAGQSH